MKIEKRKYFCENCISSVVLQDKIYERYETLICPECGHEGDLKFQGQLKEQRWEITRKWRVKAFSHDEAIGKAKNWEHFYVEARKLKEIQNEEENNRNSDNEEGEQSEQ